MNRLAEIDGIIMNDNTKVDISVVINAQEPNSNWQVVISTNNEVLIDVNIPGNWEAFGFFMNNVVQLLKNVTKNSPKNSITKFFFTQ